MTTVGPYTVLARIGEGGMGVVHLARRGEGPRVALKLLRPSVVGDEEARRRLAREVGSLRRVRSAWVAEIVDADPWAEVPYVATRYVPGLSLHEHVLEEGPLRGEDLTWNACCLAEAVASVHAAGVLHRDVKPTNVLMEGRTPILIDFGLARVADDPRITHTGWLLGTPGYLAPEILYGDDATPASDVHSWAATVAFAGTGRPPFGRGPAMAIMDRVRRGEHDLTGLTGPLADVVAACLHPEPTQRPRLEQVLAWLRPQTTRPQPAPAPPPVAAGAVDDPFTLPLALAAREFGAAVTSPVAGAPVARTQVEPTWVESHPAYAPPYAPVQPVPALERLRRGVLLLAAAATAALAAASYPWLTLAGLVVLVWLLRSGSLATSAVGDRRRLRGRRWYDGGQLLFAAPWHLVRSLPSTVVLVSWSAGLALAAGLLCYAAGTDLEAGLAVSGAALVLALWWGPGGSRVRGPVARVVRPLSRHPGRWLAALVVLLVLAGALAFRVTNANPLWTPADQRPFASLTAGSG